MQLDASLASWLILSQIPGLGNEGLRKLLQAFGSPDAVLNASVSSLAKHVRPAVARAIADDVDASSLVPVATWLDDPLNRILTIADAEYPQSLLHTVDPPLLLYVKGRLDLLNAPALAVELRITSVLLFFNALNGAQTGALSGFEAFRAIARINLGQALITFPVTVVAVLLWRLPGANWALAITAAVTCVLSQVSLRRQCKILGIRPRFSRCWAESRVLWTFSTPAFLSAALAGPAIWGANTMLVNQPGGYAEMGMYSAASQWRTAISFVPVVLAQFALPLLSNLNGERDASRYSMALRWNLVLTATAAMAVAVPVALAAPYIMRLYGRGFQQGSLLLVLSAITAVIACLNNVVGIAILSAGSVWIGCAFNGMWAAVLLAGCYRFIPTGLSLGLAGSMLAAYIAHTVWQAVYLRHRLSRSQAPHRTIDDLSFTNSTP